MYYLGREKMKGLLLGLANGPVCIAYCIPALVPFLLGEGKSTSQNTIHLIRFFVGRLTGYLCFGFLSYFTSKAITDNLHYRNLIFGCSYLIFALLMAIYCFYKPTIACSANVTKGFFKKHLSGFPNLLTIIYGFLTGINLCPPFLLVFTESIQKGTLGGSILFFIMFFVGTSIYFIPIPFIGTLRNRKELLFIGKVASIIMSVYYFYVSFKMIFMGVGL